MKFITKENFFIFLGVLKEDYEIYYPTKKGQQRFYKRYNGETKDLVLGEVRTFEPLKSFFFHAREKMAEDYKKDVPISNNKPSCIVGVKACDLKGFKIQDFVFSSQGAARSRRGQGSASGGKDYDYQDPFYLKWRKDNLIIAADCTCAIDTCFCLALKVKPFPQEDFDIALTEVEQGFVVEVGSQKGQAILDRNSSLFTEVQEEAIKEREQQRNLVIKEVEANIKKYNIPNQDIYERVIEKKYESDIWIDEAKTCVECGACNTICPTCHCFLLYDQMQDKENIRLRIWDSCLIKDFARVAGGANPRPKLWMRLRNRFEKKFDFFPKLTEIYACTGCGRCISACPAKIDIRRILQRLTSV